MAMQALINENHAHLVSLGVSHRSLETIRSTTAAEQFRLSTKLTGAGGGGCAVTLVPDGACSCTGVGSVQASWVCITDFSDSSLQDLVSALQAAGFGTYSTSVGGSGLGILSPYNHKETRAPVTPPETPAEESDASVDGASSLRQYFESIDGSTLSSWADECGRWAYV